MAEAIRRERRLNEVEHELALIELELAEPVCRPQEDVDFFQLQREWLLQERDELRASPSARSL
ncbi:MAG TPA: hypothetical protein ENN98_08235 [Desulfurivibrio alkaliphilus]|uniref:Uncharacterized protein n=1 Tax=Desulfurivibrio alkaliphilus TaxID=427923 RepID=A0A7C2XQJ3_9BACT|nr:hypothetical protein [Desulfurivibrio alkaliphilus]